MIVCVSLTDGNVFCYTRHEPVGVVGAITPVRAYSNCWVVFSLSCHDGCITECRESYGANDEWFEVEGQEEQ